jgi:hypothetical protein
VFSPRQTLQINLDKDGFCSNFSLDALLRSTGDRHRDGNVGELRITSLALMVKSCSAAGISGVMDGERLMRFRTSDAKTERELTRNGIVFMPTHVLATAKDDDGTRCRAKIKLDEEGCRSTMAASTCYDSR